MTIGPASTTTNKIVTEDGKLINIFMPSPRINPGLVVKNNILYLYGGMYEDGDKQYTLSDFYSLGKKKNSFLIELKYIS